MVKAKIAQTVSIAAAQALAEFNKQFDKAWTFGGNWNATGTEFATYINNFLFPKINETLIIDVALGNKFNWLAKEFDFIGQYSEEYVILDSVPSYMDLSREEELMLKRNYPKMATRLYGPGVLRKQKFTLNNNDVRLNFSTLGDAVGWAISVYNKRLSDINYSEETEIKGMLVDYALNQAKEKRTVTSEQELFDKLSEGILNIQNNSDKFNEATQASGGLLGRYTTVSKLSDTAILTTDKMKTYLLNSKLANTYQVAGIDLSDRIISFEDLGGTWRVTADVTISNQASVDYLRTLGDYQTRIGDIIPEGSVLTFDVTPITEIGTNFEEIKPESDLFAMVFDINCIRYKRYTKGMLKPPFYNGEFDEITYWIHYYSFKAISPFYNKLVFLGE